MIPEIFLDTDILLVIGALFLNFLVFFLIGVFKDDNSYVDIGWGLGFLVVAAVSLAVGQNFGYTVPVLMTVLVFAWGSRLTVHLGKRVFMMEEEDYRYREMRERWNNFYLNSFFKVYMFQALILLVVASPIIFVNLIGFQAIYSVPLFGFGLLVWMTGLFFEVVGDHQLKKFLESGEGKVLDKGLWRYTRHPNYFGESVIWWGFFVMAVGYTGLTGLWTVISPVTITFLLLKVSGVPLLEEKLMEEEEYREYAEKTSKFVPWFPDE